jgi:MFS family permease
MPICVAGAALLAPFSGALLDSLGYSKTLLLTNLFCIGTAVLQSVPVLQLQVLTAVFWAIGRYLLYSSLFTISGTLFSYRSFGRIIGLVSAIAGLLGLLQLPLATLTIDTWGRKFLPVQIGGAVLVAVTFVPAVVLYRLERSRL